MLTFFATTNIKIEAQMTDKKKPSAVSKTTTKARNTRGSDQTHLIIDTQNTQKKQPQSATEAPSAPVMESKPKPKPSKPKESE